MPTKLLTLVFGLAGGIGIALAIQGLSDLSDAGDGRTSNGQDSFRADAAARAAEIHSQYKRYYNSAEDYKSGVQTNALNSSNQPTIRGSSHETAVDEQTYSNSSPRDRVFDRRRTDDFVAPTVRDDRWNDRDDEYAEADSYDQPDFRTSGQHYFAQYRPSRFESDDRNPPSRWRYEADRSDDAWDARQSEWRGSRRPPFGQEQYADAGDYRRNDRDSWTDSRNDEYRSDAHRGSNFAARQLSHRGEVNDVQFADNQSGGYGGYGHRTPGSPDQRRGPTSRTSHGPVHSRDFAAHGHWGPRRQSDHGNTAFGHSGFRSSRGGYGHHGWQPPRDFGHHGFAAHGHWSGPPRHHHGDRFSAVPHRFHGHHRGHHGHHSWTHRHHFGHHSFAGHHRGGRDYQHGFDSRRFASGHHRHFGGHHGFHRGHGWGHGHHGGHHSFEAHHHRGSHHHGHFGGRHRGWAHRHGRHHGGHQQFGAGLARFAHRRHGHGPSHFPGAFGTHGTPFARIDENHDGKISKDELLKIFSTVDANSDGSVTREELMKAIAKSAEHRPQSAPTNSSDKPADQPGRRSAGPQGRGPGGFGPPGRPGQFGPGGRGPMGPPTADGFFERFDKDKKGSLTKDSVPQRLWNRISEADANKDGSVTKEELETFIKNHGFDRPNRNLESKPADKPQGENPKADDSKANAMRDQTESPVDALAADGGRTYDGI